MGRFPQIRLQRPQDFGFPVDECLPEKVQRAAAEINAPRGAGFEKRPLLLNDVVDCGNGRNLPFVLKPL